MKLISCYVAHFGKINNFTYDFQDGLNTILEDNGWGKSTLSAFIKAMLYGMEYSSKKKKLIDRRHYMPWDGSVCSGNLCLEVAGKRYRIERSFGKTDKDDSFELYDMDTGLKSADYDENIGEQIFKVDSDSFEKSINIPQLNLATAMTDSLNAKMGNLTAAKDDISNFDAALKKVQEAKSDYLRNSKINPGKLSAVKAELSACKEDYDRLPGIMSGFEAQTNLVAQKEQRLEELTRQRNKLAEKIKLQSQREQELGAYKNQKESLEHERRTLSELDDFFSAGLPDEEQLSAIEQCDRDMAVHEQALDNLDMDSKRGMKAFAKPFIGGVPTDDEFAMYNRLAAKLSELKAKAENARLSEEAQGQLTELKLFFGRLVPTEEQLTDMEKNVAQLVKLEDRISQSKERLEELQNKEQSEAAEDDGKPRLGLGIIIEIVLLVGFVIIAIAFIPYTSSQDGIMVVAAAIIAAVADLLVLVTSIHRNRHSRLQQEQNHRQHQQEAEQDLQDNQTKYQELNEELEEFINNFPLEGEGGLQENIHEIRRNLDRYEHLLNEEKALGKNAEGFLDELADVQLELFTKLQPYAEAYGINLYDMGGEYDFLVQLKKDADKYVKYMQDMEAMAHHENALRDMRARVDQMLAKYPVTKGISRSEQIHEIRNKSNEYRAISARKENLEAGIREFEAQHEQGQEINSVHELQERQSELEEQILDLNGQITQDRDNLNHTADEIERLGDTAEQIDRLQDQAAEYKQQSELLSMTGELLQKARENFLLKYMQPLQSGLHKYLAMLDTSLQEGNELKVSDIELDMDLNVKISIAGATKTADYMSQGYQDLMSLCARLALIDVLYQEEQPLIILDDPFTNMDESKIRQGVELLHTLSQSRQIIYFTCHSSRV